MIEKYAIATVFSNSGSNWLFVRRNSDLSEYKGFWSLPSTFVSKEEYNEILISGKVPNNVQKKFWDKSFSGSRSIELIFMRIGVRQRSGYRLNMALVRGKLNTPPQPNREKYSDAVFLDIIDVLQRQNFRVGTCISLLIQEMVEQAKIDSALSYLEVSPELADSVISIDEISSEELWLKALPNYLLLNTGESGSDGALIKKFTLDRFLEKYISTLTPKDNSILDVGCGGADLVYQLVKKGFKATGVDLYPDPMNKYSSSDQKLELYNCKAEEVNKIVELECTAIVVLNLVAQWVHDLNKAAMSIKQIIKKGGRVLMTIVPPEYSKNGYWNFDDGDYNWVVTEPLRRKPFLVMINRTIGPVRYYPRSTPEYISSFTKAGFFCCNSEYIYIDSLMNEVEINDLFVRRPDLRRHTKIPVFLILEFISE